MARKNVSCMTKAFENTSNWNPFDQYVHNLHLSVLPSISPTLNVLIFTYMSLEKSCWNDISYEKFVRLMLMKLTPDLTSISTTYLCRVCAQLIGRCFWCLNMPFIYALHKKNRNVKTYLRNFNCNKPVGKIKWNSVKLFTIEHFTDLEKLNLAIMVWF